MENQNKTNEKYVNLISRLKARFHNPKIAKKLATLMLSFSMMLATVSCSNLPQVEGPETDLPNDSQQETNNNNNNKGNNSTEKENDYSQMLLNVLNDNHYNTLINQAKTNPEIYKRGEFKPHPYAFLEDEGFDVNAIMNGSLDCFTMSYVKPEEPNNLYMFTRVTTENVVNNYLLKYNLTDKEMHDYEITHNTKDRGRNFCLQSVFLNNEISQLKTPTIVGESTMSKEAFDGMTSTMQHRGYADTYNCDIIMTNPNTSTYMFDLKIIPRPIEDYQMTYSYKIVEMSCMGNIIIEDDLYKMPYTYGIFKIKEQDESQIKYYFTQNAKLNSLHFKDLTQ